MPLCLNETTATLLTPACAAEVETWGQVTAVYTTPEIVRCLPEVGEWAFVVLIPVLLWLRRQRE